MSLTQTRSTKATLVNSEQWICCGLQRKLNLDHVHERALTHTHTHICAATNQMLIRRLFLVVCKLANDVSACNLMLSSNLGSASNSERSTSTNGDTPILRRLDTFLTSPNPTGEDPEGLSILQIGFSVELRCFSDGGSGLSGLMISESRNLCLMALGLTSVGFAFAFWA